MNAFAKQNPNGGVAEGVGVFLGTPTWNPNQPSFLNGWMDVW